MKKKIKAYNLNYKPCSNWLLHLRQCARLASLALASVTRSLNSPSLSLWLIKCTSPVVQKQHFEVVFVSPAHLLPYRLKSSDGFATESSLLAKFRKQLPEPLSSSPQDKLANKKSTIKVLFTLAASPGLEPRLTESESAVLPLDDEAILTLLCVI